MGYKHAGHEVWYLNEGYDMQYVECENEAGKPENDTCANSKWVMVDTKDSHIIYIGHRLPQMCTHTAPESVVGSSTFLARFN